VPSPASTRQAGADHRVRQTRGQARRDRIIAEAAELLAAKGFRGTSIAELAERVGMTHPGLLYYFGSKERLLYEVVAERERREGAEVYDELTTETATLAGLPFIAAMTIASATFTRLYVVLGAENLDADDPLHEFFVGRYERARTGVALAVMGDIARGTVDPATDVQQIANEVIATFMGLEIQWLMDPERIDYLGTVERYTEGLLKRLAPPA